MKKSFSNKEIVTLAIYLLGGNSKYIDTEDIAVKSSDLAPGRFTWRKYPDQINIDNIRKRLSDAKDQKKGGYVIGSFKNGWRLSENGLEFAKKQVKKIKNVDISRRPIDRKEMAWQRREKIRMLSTVAYEKVISDNSDSITLQEAEAFFRLDDYVTGKTREDKIIRMLTAFDDDPDLIHAIKILSERARKNDHQ
jgi:hypothetical protein